MKRLLLLLALVPFPAWAASAFDGTWKDNPTNPPADAPPWEHTIKDGRYTSSTSDPKLDIKADGTDQKVAAKWYDTLAVTVVDAKTVKFTHKKGGKVLTERVQTVQPDGKTLIAKVTEQPPQGGPISITRTHTRVTPAPAGAHAVSGSWRMVKEDIATEAAKLFTVKSTADGLMVTWPTGESYDAKFDGKDYPVKNDRAGGTVSLRKIDANTIEQTYKQDGKPLSIDHLTVAGNTMTAVSTDVKKGTKTTSTAERISAAPAR